MGSPKWTIEQEKAIKARNCSLLVAAAAGAGKTAVLVERIIQRITDKENPIDIDKLLVVTFTNAAASEMRERIGDAISKVLEKNPESISLQRQMTFLSRAHITTIHSFCLEVIRNNFHIVDLDPAFRIADDTECVLLKQEAMEEVFDGKYEEGTDEEFFNLVESYGGNKSDNALRDMVLKLYNFSRAMPHPEEWLNETAERFNIDDTFDFSTSLWADILMKDIKIELYGMLRTMKKTVELLEGASGLEGYHEHILGEYNSLREIASSSLHSWDALRNAVRSFEFEKLPRAKKDADKDIQERAKEARDDVKDKIKKISNDVLKSDSNSIKEEMKKLYPSMKALAGLVKLFSQSYIARKKEKGVIDFNDIEHYCIGILTQRDDEGNIVPTKAAFRYREEFEEILIDEYQDSNMVQELILTTISRVSSGKPNIFMVGDVKQSIYRFRQAKPELFLEKYNTYSDGDFDRERRILLYKNFRSRKEVIDGANYIFKGIMSKNIGELEYDDSEKLNPGAQYGSPQEEETSWGGSIELHIIESGKADEEETQNRDDEAEAQDEDLVDMEDNIDGVQLEARMVASRINELVSRKSAKRFMVFDKSLNAYRVAEYKDIVILMRATASAAPVFMEELGNAGIPVYADTGTGYFETDEIQTILSLLQIIDNPMQDIPLISVLRSPIAPFSPEELIEIRMTVGKKSFYEALKQKAQSGDDDVGIKAEAFLISLEKWRDKSVNMPISEFIWYLYNDTGYYAYAGAMPGGVQRQGNLRILFERAREYEETSLKGLFNFINFIKKLQKSSGDMGSAKMLGENENVVRIMSIHKSKGLEFPVTIVCGLGRRFNMRDLNSPILFHHQLGLGPDFVDSKKRYCYHTVIKQALKKKIKIESLSEEMRILYVALTRAKEKLILTGTVNNVDKSCGYWGKVSDNPGIKIAEHNIMGGKNFLDWICPVLMKHSGLGTLRDAAGLKGLPLDAVVEDESIWEVVLHNKKSVLSQKSKTEEEAAAGLEITDEEGRDAVMDEVRRRLEWQYGYGESSKLPAKLSVTELKKRMGTNIEDEYTRNIFMQPINKKPAFLEQSSGMSAAERGTIMHLVMQHIAMDRVPSAGDIEQLVRGLVENEFMTAAQVEAVNSGKIIKFFKSPFGQRLVKAGNGKREVPFYMEIESTEVYNDLSDDKYKEEKILLQGIIDCYFEEEDGLVLLDYKTDFVNQDNIDTVRAKYSLQIDYYTRALEKMTGKKVKEKYIYLFHNGEVLEF